MFFLDSGSPLVLLNNAYWRLDPTTGVDTLQTGDPLTPGHTFVNVHTMRVGSLVYHFDTTHVESAGQFRNNAIVWPKEDRFQSFNPPVLGFFGQPALAPFETIIDYTHQRLVLIRLDSAGRRRVPVPAYTPATTIPLVVAPSGQHYGVMASIGTVQQELDIDTGSPVNVLTQTVSTALKDQVVAEDTASVTINHLRLGTRPYDSVRFYKIDDLAKLNMLGYPFLSRHSAVGLNYRTHELILYKPTRGQ
jgi:hypothetical protein